MLNVCDPHIIAAWETLKGPWKAFSLSETRLSPAKSHLVSVSERDRLLQSGHG